MDMIYDWIRCICTTMILSTILSFLAPNYSGSKYYKVLIKVFILFSFLYPFVNNDFEFNALNQNYDSNQKYVEYQENVGDKLIKNSIKELLNRENIKGSIVDVSSFINKNEEIEINDITVLIPDEYDTNLVKNIIFEHLSLNVEVTHIGE